MYEVISNRYLYHFFGLTKYVYLLEFINVAHVVKRATRTQTI